MIPAAPSPRDDEKHHRARQEYEQPPVPIRGLEQVADVVLTARTSWCQDVRDASAPVDYKDITAAVVAHRVGLIDNPIRELARHLLEFADRLDSDGIVPLGVNVVTGYNQYHDGVVNHRSGKAAEVVTTVRGVRRAWLTDVLDAEVEQARREPDQ